MGRISYDEQDKYESSGNGEWFSLKNDGEIARVQFMADSPDDLEIFACHRVKIGEKERYVDCLRSYNDPIDVCPLCAAGVPVKPVRFVVMYQHDDGKVKIWERGKQFIGKLQGLFNRYTPLSNYVFEIERHGKAGDKETKYEIFPMDRVEPFDLSEVEKPELQGGLIMEKSAEEMEIFLQTGNFPSDDEPEAPPARTDVRRRGAPETTRRAPATAAPATSTPATTTPPAGVSRRGAPSTAPAETATPSGGRSGRSAGNREVF